MQEMSFVLEHFADLCDIRSSDAVQEGDAGRNDPAATWTYMVGRLRKMGGGKTGRNKSYKERTFELGKNELRYKAGATKGGSWQTIDLSSGTVMADMPPFGPCTWNWAPGYTPCGTWTCICTMMAAMRQRTRYTKVLAATTGTVARSS